MLVGLMGQAQAGKDTCANYLSKYYRFYVHSFAAKLKELTIDLFDLSYPQVNTTDGKRTLDPRYNKTPRTLLQDVGTALRNVWKEVWVEYLLRKIDMHYEPEDPVAVSDVRYINEVTGIKSVGGIIIQVIRMDYKALSGSEALHPSETEQLGIPANLIDYTITAKSGDLQALYDQLDVIMAKLGLTKEETSGK